MTNSSEIQPHSMPPELRLNQLLLGKFISRALGSAAELGIADLLVAGPLSAEELAVRTQSNADGLYRVLRGLAAVGVFSEQPGRLFANNDVSKFLRSDVQGSLRALVRWIHDESGWRAWERLDHSVRTGQPAFNEVFGEDCFSWLARHPSSLAVFQQAMTEYSGVTGIAVAESYDFSPVRKLVDVGGGHGTLLSLVLERFRNVRGVLFDRPEVIRGASDVLGRFSHGDRIELVSGDFLAGVPSGADAYIMKHILHDWDDEHCVTLLRHCRQALVPGGRVLIVDAVLSDGPEGSFPKLLDLEMLVMTPGGRERTEREFAALLDKAGLALERVVPTLSPVSVLEAFAK